MIRVPIGKQSFGFYYNENGGVESFIFNNTHDLSKLIQTLTEVRDKELIYNN